MRATTHVAKTATSAMKVLTGSVIPTVNTGLSNLSGTRKVKIMIPGRKNTKAIQIHRRLRSLFLINRSVWGDSGLSGLGPLVKPGTLGKYLPPAEGYNGGTE